MFNFEEQPMFMAKNIGKEIRMSHGFVRVYFNCKPVESLSQARLPIREKCSLEIGKRSVA